MSPHHAGSGGTGRVTIQTKGPWPGNPKQSTARGRRRRQCTKPPGHWQEGNPKGQMPQATQVGESTGEWETHPQLRRSGGVIPVQQPSPPSLHVERHPPLGQARIIIGFSPNWLMLGTVPLTLKTSKTVILQPQPYKRGRHSPGYRCNNKRACSQEISDQRARELILHEGMLFKAPEWIQRHNNNNRKSVLVLADKLLNYWPQADKICDVVFHKDWPINRWVQALKLGVIRVEAHSVALYLEATCSWTEVPPSRTVWQLYAGPSGIWGTTPRYLSAITCPGWWPALCSTLSLTPTLHCNWLSGAHPKQWKGGCLRYPSMSILHPRRGRFVKCTSCLQMQKHCRGMDV